MATRKEDKLRPYRVDYFNIDEMKDVDMALVRSVTVRAVTSAEAATKALDEMLDAASPIVLIRSYRFYKKVTNNGTSYKAIEDLFNEKNALIVMDEVEKYRAEQVAAVVVPDHAVADPASGVDKATFYKNNAGTQMLQADDNNGHVTRYSDSSLYDEVCVHCGATDTSGGLSYPCSATPAPTSGPNSPATVAVVDDLAGMLSHDQHEQTMDKFVPDSVPEGRTFTSNADMKTEVTPFGEKCPECEDPISLMPGTPDLRGVPAPTWQKILLFAGMLGGIMLLLWLILPHK